MFPNIKCVGPNINIFAFSKLLIAGFALVFLGCASTREVARDFREQSTVGRQAASSLVLLIDGLSYDLLKRLLDEKRLPNLAYFFAQTQGPSLYQMRSVFPSLTYPNITSLLTLAPPNQHPIYGNRITAPKGRKLTDPKGRGSFEVINFENPISNAKLNQLIKPQTIFSRLQSHNQDSVSFSYSFHAGTQANVKLNLLAGIQYANMDYAAFDQDLIAGAELLFTKGAQELPRLVFMHLIGVDALSHKYGPESVLVERYLIRLDHLLQPLFEKIRQREKTTTITSLLLTDHGLTSIDHTMNIEKVVARVTASQISKDKRSPLILNETRIAAIVFPADWQAVDKVSLASQLAQKNGIAAVVLRENDTLRFLFPGQELSANYVREMSCPPYDFGLEYRGTKACPQTLDSLYKLTHFQFAFESLAAYFATDSNSSSPNTLPGGEGAADATRTNHRPEAVILASDNWGLNDSYRGGHGGLTRAEMITPLMLRNARVSFGYSPTQSGTMPDPANLPIYQILRFILPN